MNPFDYVRSISETKVDIMEEGGAAESGYPAFMVNRALSYFPDCIFYADALNQYADLPPRLQYDYLLNIVRTKKRYSGKWAKKVDDKDLDLIAEYYGYGPAKAREAREVLTVAQIEVIRSKLFKGG
jgi:hypothetical protein